jgi:hypothetical protein
MKKIYIQSFIEFLFIIICGCSSSHISSYTSFDFHFVSLGTEVSTFEGYIIKDLVMDGSIKTWYFMPAADKETILEKLKAIGFFEQSDKVNLGNLFSLRVEYNGIEKFTSWGGFTSDNEYQIKLGELGRIIMDIIESSTEFQSLPPARGGRL